jgi:hypothetical protein
MPRVHNSLDFDAAHFLTLRPDLAQTAGIIRSSTTTRWTLVIAAGDAQRKEDRSALVSLCEKNGYPLYAYPRRRRYPADQAQDLTQAFFIPVLERRYLGRPDREKGGFRSLFLTSLKFFVADEHDRHLYLYRPILR